MEEYVPIYEIIALAYLFCWLVFETIWDLRTCDHAIPVWFSLAILLPALVWLGYFVSPWAALLMAVSIVSTDIYQRSLVLGFLGMFAPPPLVVFIFPTLLPLVIGWAVLLSLWFLRVLGGADALAALALLLFFPSWIMVMAILAGILCWSLALLWLKHRKDIGLRLWTVLSSRAAGTRQAGLGAYVLAVLFYVAYCFLVGVL
jgi:hypothetical protein